MEDELLRLDPSIADHDSIFIAQEREISHFVAAYRARLIPIAEDEQADAAHAWVMLQQCDDQIRRFRQLALHKGSDLKLTYLLERLEQILARIRTLLGIFDAKDEGTTNPWPILVYQHHLHLFLASSFLVLVAAAVDCCSPQSRHCHYWLPSCLQ